jgi:hypothetical protein
MYYRVAIQVDAQPTWKWKSTPLSSLNILIHWLQYYRVLPHDRLRIFSSRSQEELNEQLMRENQGLDSPSVPATQFLQERKIVPQGVVREAGTDGTRADERTASLPAKPTPTPDKSGISLLDRRREEIERGGGGDHDLPYQFTLPTALPQVLAWARLLARVQRRDFHPGWEPLEAATRAQAREWAVPHSADTTRKAADTLHVRNEETEQRGEQMV